MGMVPVLRMLRKRLVNGGVLLFNVKSVTYAIGSVAFTVGCFPECSAHIPRREAGPHQCSLQLS